MRVQNTYTASDYYQILGLPVDSSVEDIKKAYRKLARLSHPDLNHSPGAAEQFIRATEAYEFLLANHVRIKSDMEAYRQAMEDWRMYRQQVTRKRAARYARSSYSAFRNSRVYRSTRILDGTTILFSFAISFIVIGYAIWGYVYRLKNPIPGLEKPSVITFLMLLLLGLVFASVSFIYLMAYMETLKRRKNKTRSVA